MEQIYKKNRKPNLASEGALGTKEFLASVEAAARAALPRSLAGQVHARIRFSLLQLYFRDPSVHYEVWIQRPSARMRRPNPARLQGKVGTIEMGLHFEGPDRERNVALLARLVSQADKIIEALGPRVEPEEWTRSWTRLHESLPLPARLEPAHAAELGSRVASWVAACQPLLARAPGARRAMRKVSRKSRHTDSPGRSGGQHSVT